MPVLAGHVIYANGTRSGQPLVVLTAPDADGFLRFAPLVAAGTLGQGFGMELEPADFVSGGLTAWLRLDRVGWQYIEGAESAGMLKPAALARLHRALCTHEARSYADIAHRPAAFVPGKTAVPPSGNWSRRHTRRI